MVTLIPRTTLAKTQTILVALVYIIMVPVSYLIIHSYPEESNTWLVPVCIVGFSAFTLIWGGVIERLSTKNPPRFLSGKSSDIFKKILVSAAPIVVILIHSMFLWFFYIVIQGFLETGKPLG